MQMSRFINLFIFNTYFQQITSSFSLYINDIMVGTESENPLFADDFVCYRQIDSTEDTSKRRKDIDQLGKWARKWGIRFQPVKCNIMQLTKKRIKKINAIYSSEGTVLENVDIKYFSGTISKDLKWNIHVSKVCTKANRTLGFFRRNLSSCHQYVKQAAYKGLVRPILEYASPVWDPHGIVVQEELEKVQNRAAMFVTGNYNFETGSMTGIIEPLGWESLHKRRKSGKLIFLFKGLKGGANIPCDDLQSPNRRSRNQHPMAYARTDIYKYSFFPDTIRDWNALPAAIISSAVSSEDPVARFTSFVRSRD